MWNHYQTVAGVNDDMTAEYIWFSCRLLLWGGRLSLEDIGIDSIFLFGEGWSVY